MRVVCFGMRHNGICSCGPEEGFQNILSFISQTCEQSHPTLISSRISDSGRKSSAQTLTVYIHLVDYIVRMTYL